MLHLPLDIAYFLFYLFCFDMKSCHFKHLFIWTVVLCTAFPILLDWILFEIQIQSKPFLHSNFCQIVTEKLTNTLGLFLLTIKKIWDKQLNKDKFCFSSQFGKLLQAQMILLHLRQWQENISQWNKSRRNKISHGNQSQKGKKRSARSINITFSAILLIAFLPSTRFYVLNVPSFTNGTLVLSARLLW